MNKTPLAGLSCPKGLERKLENAGYDDAEYGVALDRFRAKYALAPGQEWEKLTEMGGYTFAEIFRYELAALAGEKSRPAEPPPESNAYRDAHAATLSGLAFSGGGIRSATFNLGVIQALAEMKLLSHFDYMSTVSGGGYIGGWLSKWTWECGGDIHKVEEELANKKFSFEPLTQPWPVQFLRRYSNYLTPRVGLFSADTWTLVCTYCRNTMLNMVILLSWLAVLFLMPRLILIPATLDHADAARQPIWIGLAMAFFLWTVACIALSISRKGKLPDHGLGSQSQAAILWMVCLPLLLAAFFGAFAVWGHLQALADYWNGLPSTFWDPASLWLLGPGLLYIGAWCAGWTYARYLNARTEGGSDRQDHILRLAAGHFISAVTALTVGTILLLTGVAAFHGAQPVMGVATGGTALSAQAAGDVMTMRLATFGVPLMLSLFGVTVTLVIGLVGRLYQEQSREWWARHGAWTVICAICWGFVCGAAFYLPPLLAYAWESRPEWTGVAGALSSLVTIVGLKSGSGKATGKAESSKVKEALAQFAPYAFMMLAISLLCAGLQRLVAPAAVEATAGLGAYITAFERSSAAALHGVTPADALIGIWALVAGLLVTILVLGWRVDVNKFSLYMMYRLRLVRAYFGASTKNRAPHPFTGFDPKDDIKLAELCKKDGTVQRPYHLINAAVNMVGGKELAWQTRKAANFCFSPMYSGFELPTMPPDSMRWRLPRGAYRPTERYASQMAPFKDNDAGVHLGMAVAVSGAAASPNMGYHSSPPLSFLMTLFNLRLGRWSPNPVKADSWQRAAPYNGIASILSELFGLTDTRAKFLYLSDGGHFENLGLYELVRRRCRLIVAIDASADAGFKFGDLGNAIRRCQTDLNVPISIKTSDMTTLGPPQPRAVSFVTGTIRYSQADGPQAEEGVLLYIKPNIVGDENADIANYSKRYPGFPHQSTADQFFDEDQFESYRMLGHGAASAALRDLVPILAKEFGALPVAPALRPKVTRCICKELL
ncbi:patatin-like phospholipase family protein [Massilia sp. HP4]|uniref:patatin-like phospholipase family protein n=1 Tax=Massilia sp. HP4 TaxID=2562316 RepID=UPI0010BFAE68|nr:patatin-like phospholipase family protein [Massilia sp. HP4]